MADASDKKRTFRKFTYRVGRGALNNFVQEEESRAGCFKACVLASCSSLSAACCNCQHTGGGPGPAPGLEQ
eukprot:1147642-Pelagomonas_calceolata.AAC.4